MSDLDNWLANAAPADTSPEQPTAPAPVAASVHPAPLALPEPDRYDVDATGLARRVAARYRSGETINDLAREYHVGSQTMRALLIAGGARIRPPVARRQRRSLVVRDPSGRLSPEAARAGAVVVVAAAEAEPQW